MNETSTKTYLTSPIVFELDVFRVTKCRLSTKENFEIESLYINQHNINTSVVEMFLVHEIIQPHGIDRDTIMNVDISTSITYSVLFKT